MPCADTAAGIGGWRRGEWGTWHLLPGADRAVRVSHPTPRGAQSSTAQPRALTDAQLEKICIKDYRSGKELGLQVLLLLPRALRCLFPPSLASLVPHPALKRQPGNLTPSNQRLNFMARIFTARLWVLFPYSCTH